MKVNIDIVKQKVMDFDLKEALKILADNLSNSDYEDQVMLLNQRFHRAEKERHDGLISDDDFDTDMNKLTLSISNFLKELKSDFVTKTLVFEPKIRFFPSGFDVVPEFKNRAYSDILKKTDLAAVGWELRSSCPAVKNPVSMSLKWRIQSPKNVWSAVVTTVLTIQEGWAGNWFVRTWGYKEAGKMEVGIYNLEVIINDEVTMKGSFEVV